MLLKVLLGLLGLQIATSIAADVQVTDSNYEFDNFVPMLATPAKDVFDWKLLQKYTSAKGYKNVILSPISLKLVLALLYEGSGSLAEKEFQKVLKFSPDKSQLRLSFQQLLDELIVKRDRYIINIGTKLFLASHLRVEPTFLTKASTYYSTEVLGTNFSNPQEASSNINLWVQYVTNDRIKSIVTPDDVKNAVLLVTNAIYFKGMWSHPFLRNETSVGGFYTSSNQSVPVPYMTVTEKLFYTDSVTLDAEILRLPYKGNKFGLFIVLPHSKSGLSYLIDNLNLNELTLAVSIMEQRPIQVVLPRFRFDFQARYSQVLREFGFETIFSGAASFPGIVRDQEADLIVTDILQKSGIEVNEEGSIVHTATQVNIGNKFGDETVIKFNASRPFLFYIQEDVTKNILFIGKIENPLDVDSNSEPSYPTDATPVELPAAVPDSDQVFYQPITPTNSQFDLQLLKTATGNSKNVFLSPASIKVSLAMLAEAGSGPTSQEIYDALQIQYETKNQVLQSLVAELSESYPHSTLEFQNALFVSDKQRVNKSYQAGVERYYRALIKQINYRNTQYAASEINNFIKNATKGFIQLLLSPDDIDPNTEIILANALYFKATWLKIFEQKLTKEGTFNGAIRNVKVSFMHIIDIFSFGETPNSYIVQLNYAGNYRAMLLVIPKDKNGLLAALTDMEAYRSISDLIDALNQTEVELIMPKFEIDYGYDLVGILEKLGIRKVFSADSNLSNLFENNKSGLVNSFIHKAKIEVTEEGTEASAVSLVPVIPLMGTSTPKVKADRPFAFFVYNTQTKTILFEGILNQPEESAVPERKTTNANVRPETVHYNQFPTRPTQNERQGYHYVI